jgi:predicted RNA binding protein YcfA (HicA-like mRNA interferase family)
MPKRRKFSGDSLCKLLEDSEFIPVRQRGSHRILQKILPTGTITVPVPIHKNLKRFVTFVALRPNDPIISCA